MEGVVLKITTSKLMFQTAPKSCTITIAERPDPEFRTPSWTPKSWPATETYAWCRGDPPRGSRTPPTPRLRVTAVARTDSLTGTPIDQARHPPRTPPLPTKHPSPLCLGVCSPRAPRHPLLHIPFPSPTDSHSRSPPTQHRDRERSSRQTRTDAMATLTVPASVPPVAEDCEQLHKAFEGPARARARALVRRTRSTTADARLCFDLSQVGAPTRSSSSPSWHTATPRTAARSAAPTPRSTARSCSAPSAMRSTASSRYSTSRSIDPSRGRSRIGPRLMLINYVGGLIR